MVGGGHRDRVRSNQRPGGGDDGSIWQWCWPRSSCRRRATVAQNRPARAVDSCLDADGELLAAGDDVWSGILDDRPDGACTRDSPLYSTSR